MTRWACLQLFLSLVLQVIVQEVAAPALKSLSLQALLRRPASFRQESLPQIPRDLSDLVVSFRACRRNCLFSPKSCYQFPFSLRHCCFFHRAHYWIGTGRKGKAQELCRNLKPRRCCDGNSFILLISPGGHPLLWPTAASCFCHCAKQDVHLPLSCRSAPASVSEQSSGLVRTY